MTEHGHVIMLIGTSCLYTMAGRFFMIGALLFPLSPPMTSAPMFQMPLPYSGYVSPSNRVADMTIDYRKEPLANFWKNEQQEKESA